MESKILESLWDDFRFKSVKPDAHPEDVKAIAKIFYAGMLAMLGEIVEVNKDIWKVLREEFEEFDKELKDENQRRNNTT